MAAISLFDGHCDTLMQIGMNGGGLRRREGHLDLARTRPLARYAQFFAIFGAAEDLPPGRTLPAGRLWPVFLEQHRLFRREMACNGDWILPCRSGAEAWAAFSAHKSAAFLSVEGAELLDCDLEKLERAHRMGVRAVNLTWNHANALSGSNAEEPERGLSPLGRSFVVRLGELGMLADLSHLSDPGFRDVAEMSQKPLFASHSNARAVFFHPRNLTDAQFTAIIDSNGVAGLNLYANFLGERPDADTVIAHLEHFWSLGGEKHVALGGDWDGCSALPAGFQGIQDMERLYDRLLQRNYGTSLLDDLFFNNLMRVVSEVCTM